MKKPLVFIMMLVASAAFALPAAAQVYVRVGPPPPRYEAMPRRPGPGYSWQAGEWFWNGNRYVWHPGHFVRHGGHWVPAHWRRTPHGWVRVPGHWD